MPTYTAWYFTAADYARHTLEAETPAQAMEMARSLYDENLGELNFRSYDEIEPLQQVEIRDDGYVTCASWQSQDYRLRQAAPDLLRVLDQAREALNTAPRFAVPGLAADSYDIAARCDAAIAKARGPTVEPEQSDPPPRRDRDIDFDR